MNKVRSEHPRTICCYAVHYIRPRTLYQVLGVRSQMIRHPTRFTLDLAAEGMRDRGNRNHQIVSPPGICAKSLARLPCCRHQFLYCFALPANDDGRGMSLGMSRTLRSSGHQEGPDDQPWAKSLHFVETYVSLQ